MLRVTLLWWTIGTLLVTSVAHADARACVRSHAAGQDEVRQGKLLQAKQYFSSCAVNECPADVRVECLRLSQDVEKRTPSIVLVVSDATGSDVVEAEVYANQVRVARLNSSPPTGLSPPRRVAVQR